MRLFSQGSLQRSLEAHGDGIKREVDTAPEQHVLQADELEWAKALAERYAVEPLVLQRERVYMSPSEAAQVDVSWDSFMRNIPDPSRPAYVPGHRTVVHIPFTGEADVFKARPNPHSMTYPEADGRNGELLLVIEYPDDRPVNIKGRTDAFLLEIAHNVQAAAANVEHVNSGLLNTAQRAIRERRERVEKHQAHLAATGLPIGPPKDKSKTYVAEAIVRRPAPVLPQARTQPMPLEPVLEDAVYEHILSVVRQHTLSMEQSPQTYANMGEEDRRHVILGGSTRSTPAPARQKASSCRHRSRGRIRRRHIVARRRKSRPRRASVVPNRLAAEEVARLLTGGGFEGRRHLGGCGT